MRYRYLPRDGVIMVEPVRAGVCIGASEAARTEPFLFDLEFDPGRGVRADQRRDA
jgi:hypothetical protein